MLSQPPKNGPHTFVGPIKSCIKYCISGKEFFLNPNFHQVYNSQAVLVWVAYFMAYFMAFGGTQKCKGPDEGVDGWQPLKPLKMLKLSKNLWKIATFDQNFQVFYAQISPIL